MKNKSVKLKITLLLTILMAFLSILLLIFMLFISSSVALQTTRQQLTDTVRSNVAYIEVTDHKPNIQEGFSFYHNGISTLIYSANESLIAGQIPVSFQAEVPFENGSIRTIDSGENKYLVLDFWLASDWNHGVWLRGLAEAPDSRALTQNLLLIALITLPVFMIFAALGSYHISRRAFRPLEHITATAEAINEARDLSGRIALPPGKDEFSRLAADFDKMFERLERSFEAEKQFTADASHELRTPISIIKGACEYAKKYDETPEDHAETISMIHRQADKMSALVSQLLSMTRMEQGIENTKFERLDLGEFTHTFCTEQPWEHSRLTFNISSGIFVQANEELLGRLIRNLVENSFKYTSETEHIWLTVTSEQNEAILSVQDNGIGISPEDQEKIWNRFYQVDSSRSNDDGSGLGLSMVKQIAEIHKGYMTLESAPDKGSTFTLHLPFDKK